MFQFEVDVLTEEVLALLVRVNDALQPKTMALSLTARLRESFQEQIKQAFSAQGPDWPALSDMRVRDRGGSTNPILDWTGSFKDEVTRYKGRILLRETSFDYEFPGKQEVSRRYFGLAAGQLVNPLGLTPLALFPRPLLGGAEKQKNETILALVEYFQRQGWEVQVL